MLYTNIAIVAFFLLHMTLVLNKYLYTNVIYFIKDVLTSEGGKLVILIYYTLIFSTLYITIIGFSFYHNSKLTIIMFFVNFFASLLVYKRNRLIRRRILKNYYF